MLLSFSVALVDGILLGITLAKRPQRKRKIVLFSILFAVSYFLCHMITIGFAVGIVDGESFLGVFDSGLATPYGYIAAIYAIEGILFGLLSSLITNKVCKK